MKAGLLGFTIVLFGLKKDDLIAVFIGFVVVSLEALRLLPLSKFY
jgi:hypothetical protein